MRFTHESCKQMVSAVFARQHGVSDQALPSKALLPPIIRPGELVRDLSRNVTGFSALVSIASSFISFGPCLFATDPSGIQIAPSAIDIGPTGEPPMAA